MHSSCAHSAPLLGVHTPTPHTRSNLTSQLAIRNDSCANSLKKVECPNATITRSGRLNTHARNAPTRCCVGGMVVKRSVAGFYTYTTHYTLSSLVLSREFITRVTAQFGACVGLYHHTCGSSSKCRASCVGWVWACYSYCSIGI